MPNDRETAYQTDILGEPFQQLKLHFKADYDGSVEATLVRRKAEAPQGKAVLYIHGFIDYFFQKEMAERFNREGYHFYALDLRKYGRSLLPHQEPYFVLDLNEYDEEISLALEIIHQEGHEAVVLAGHSTGGLTATLYAVHHPHHPIIKALWLNSPFYDFNMPAIKKKLALPLVSRLGRKMPRFKIPSELNRFYVQSIHRNFNGEWDFDLNLKPVSYPKVNLSFIHAIYQAHKEIQSKPQLHVPALVMHSDRSSNPKKFNRDVTRSDVILDVKSIKKYAKQLQGDVTVMTIKSGLHDLALSIPPVREHVYRALFKWLSLQFTE